MPTIHYNMSDATYDVHEDGRVLFDGATKEDAEGWAAAYVAKQGGQVSHGEPVTTPDHIDVPSVETDRLISAAKVEGTAVYGTDGGKLGTVKSVMISKTGGQVTYAVLSMGGILGLGESLHPLPWGALDYDTSLKGYKIAYDRDLLTKAPTLNAGEEPRLDDRAYEDELHSHYGATPYYTRDAV